MNDFADMDCPLCGHELMYNIEFCALLCVSCGYEAERCIDCDEYSPFCDCGDKDENV